MPVASAGRMAAVRIADAGECLRLIEDGPVANAITERVRDDSSVFREPLCRTPMRPSAGILERLGQVPVIQSRKWADLRLEQGIGQALVVVETLRIGLPAPGGLDSRPRDREAIAREVQLLEQGDVFAIAVVAVAGHIAGVAVLDVPRRVREAVPDRLAPAIDVPGALDLVGRG